MIVDRDTNLGEITFAAFDLETTGMDPVRDKIIEIGIVTFKKNEILQSIEWLVNPGIPIPKVALEIHGIDDAMVEGQPLLPEVLSDVLAALSDVVPVAHNVSFDLSFLLEAARNGRLAFAPSPVVDTCILARRVFPRLTSHKLSSLVKELNLDGNQSHRALSDAISCSSLLARSVELLPLQWETPWEEFQGMFSGIFSLDFDRSTLPEKLSPFEQALHERKRLLLSYRDGQGQVTQREVTPMGVSVDDRRRAVILGYCHMRQGTRTFRLDRILEIQVS